MKEELDAAHIKQIKKRIAKFDLESSDQEKIATTVWSDEMKIALSEGLNRQGHKETYQDYMSPNFVWFDWAHRRIIISN